MRFQITIRADEDVLEYRKDGVKRHFPEQVPGEEQIDGGCILTFSLTELTYEDEAYLQQSGYKWRIIDAGTSGKERDRILISLQDLLQRVRVNVGGEEEWVAADVRIDGASLALEPAARNRRIIRLTPHVISDREYEGCR